MANRPTSAQKAARTKPRRKAAQKAAKTRKLKAAGRKAAKTRKRSRAAAKAAKTKQRRRQVAAPPPIPEAVRKYLVTVSKGKSEDVQPPTTDETEVGIRFARKSTVKVFPGNMLAGNWNFTMQGACTIPSSSGIFIPRIQDVDEIPGCPDGENVVRVTLK